MTQRFWKTDGTQGGGFARWCLLLALFLAVGCGGERDRGMSHYQRARKLVLNQEYEAGRRAFEQSLHWQPDYPPAHLELALLCEEQFRDIRAAARHYREFLRLAPDDPQRPAVERWLDRVETALFEELSARYSGGMRNEEVEALRAERDDLARRLSDAAVLFRDMEAAKQSLREELARSEQARLAALQQSVSATVERVSRAAPEPPPAPAPPPSRPPPPPVREHLVVTGDTLAAISRNYYGSVRYWPRLQAYNQEVLGGGTRLDVGQRLRIPPVEVLERLVVRPQGEGE